MPTSWVQDEDVWEKAKKAASESGQGDNYAVITAIYKKMGGRKKQALKKAEYDAQYLMLLLKALAQVYVPPSQGRKGYYRMQEVGEHPSGPDHSGSAKPYEYKDAQEKHFDARWAAAHNKADKEHGKPKDEKERDVKAVSRWKHLIQGGINEGAKKHFFDALHDEISHNPALLDKIAESVGISLRNKGVKDVYEAVFRRASSALAKALDLDSEFVYGRLEMLKAQLESPAAYLEELLKARPTKYISRTRKGDRYVYKYHAEANKNRDARAEKVVNHLKGLQEKFEAGDESAGREFNHMYDILKNDHPEYFEGLASAGLKRLDTKEPEKKSAADKLKAAIGDKNKKVIKSNDVDSIKKQKDFIINAVKSVSDEVNNKLSKLEAAGKAGNDRYASPEYDRILFGGLKEIENKIKDITKNINLDDPKIRDFRNNILAAAQDYIVKGDKESINKILSGKNPADKLKAAIGKKPSADASEKYKPDDSIKEADAKTAQDMKDAESLFHDYKKLEDQYQKDIKLLNDKRQDLYKPFISGKMKDFLGRPVGVDSEIDEMEKLLRYRLDRPNFGLLSKEDARVELGPLEKRKKISDKNAKRRDQLKNWLAGGYEEMLGYMTKQAAAYKQAKDIDKQKENLIQKSKKAQAPIMAKLEEIWKNNQLERSNLEKMRNKIMYGY